MLRYTRCNIVILMANHVEVYPIQHSDFDGCNCVADIVLQFLYRVRIWFVYRTFPWGHLKSTVYERNPHTIQEVKDNISHTVAAIKITMLHRIYLNMVTAGLLTNCSNALPNIHTNARENITRTRAKREACYFFVAHSVLMLLSLPSPSKTALCGTAFPEVCTF